MMRRSKIKYTPKLTTSRRSEDHANAEAESLTRVVESQAALPTPQASPLNQDRSQETKDIENPRNLSTSPPGSYSVDPKPSLSTLLTSNDLSNSKPASSSIPHPSSTSSPATNTSSDQTNAVSKRPKATTVIVNVTNLSDNDEGISTIENMVKTSSIDSNNNNNNDAPANLIDSSTTEKFSATLVQTSQSNNKQVELSVRNDPSSEKLVGEDKRSRVGLRNGNLRASRTAIKPSQPLKSPISEGSSSCKTNTHTEAIISAKNVENRPKKRLRISSKDLIDRSKLTMYDLIHNPLSTKRRGRKKKVSQESGESSSSDDDASSVRTRSSDKSTTNKPAQNDSSTMSNDVASSALAKDPNDISISQEEPSGKQSAGPRVKVGPDGQIILDEESLVIKKPKEVQETVIATSANGKVTYSSFRKKSRSTRWSKEETLKFYTALNLIGPDFSLMSKLFFKSSRSRTDLKNKFRRENKLNKSVIENALYEVANDYGMAQEAFAEKILT